MSTVLWFSLILCITYTILADNVPQHKPDITMLTMFDSKTLTCVGGNNTYDSALTFITPLEPRYAEQNPKSTYHIPNGSPSVGKFNCDFNKSSKCVSSWTKNQHVIKESGVVHIEPVLDERWERFEMKYTDSTKLLPYNFTSNQTYMTISLRSDSDVYIFLCENKKRDDNMQCYRITIPKPNETSHVQIEHCTNVNDTSYTYHRLKCRELLKGTGGSLKTNSWGHYTVHSNLNETDIKVYVPGGENSILQYSNKSKQISSIFLSSFERAFWKIHQYSYLELNVTDTFKQIGPSYTATSDSMCLSMYVALCSTCTLYIRITKVKTRTINDSSGKYMEWQHVRLTIPVIHGQSYILEIKGTNTGNKTDFWAIDDLRECNVTESRKIEMKVDNYENTIFCQALKSPDWNVSINGTQAPDPDAFFCNNTDYIGMNCDISCKSVTPTVGYHCNSHRICKLAGNENQIICTCAAAYEGNKCDEGCNNSTGNSEVYGYKCQHHCGQCKDNEFCMKFSGHCPNNCKNGYEEPYCNNLLYPRLKNPLKIINSTLNTVTVQLASIETEGKHEATTFQIQFKLKTGGIWENFSEAQKFKRSTLVTINKLEREKDYLFRAVLYTSEGNSYNETVPEVETFTDCKGISSDTDVITNITITPAAKNLTIRWHSVCKRVMTVSLNCTENEWCTMEYQYNREDQFLSTTDNRTFTGLTPYTKYKIRILDPNKKQYFHQQIRTSASEPGPVRNLAVYSRDEGYLSLRWKPPFPPHGELEYYELIYTTCDSRNSTTVKIERKPCKIWDNYACLNITNVQKNKCYIVTIHAKNKNVTNLSESSVQTETKQGISERPRDLVGKWNDQDELTLNWKNPFITNGDLNSFVITLEEIEGMRNTYNDTYNIGEMKQDYSYKIQMNIRLSTRYNISVYGMNKHQGDRATINNTMTPPTTPALLTNITAGTRTNTSQIITIPGVNTSASDSKCMYVVICDPTQVSVGKTMIAAIYNITKQTDCPGTAWIAAELPINAAETTFTVGNNKTENHKRLKTNLDNKALKPDIKYQVSVILENSYNGAYRYKSYSVTTSAPLQPKESNPALYALLLLLLLPALIWFIYRHRTGIKRESSSNDQQHIGISLSSIKNSLNPTRQNVNNKTESGSVTQPLLQNRANDQIHSRVVTIGNLADYIKKATQNGDLEQQHKLFTKGPTKPWDYGMLKENKFKNRYANLSAYDGTRVILKTIHDDPYSDFINANYIDGYQQAKAYIATQGPKLTTINDFWRMIWQEKVICIVMVANTEEGGKRKCEQYWPDTDSCKEFINIVVTSMRSDIFADFVYRTFEVKCEGETRIVIHISSVTEYLQIQQLHFTSWPDHGVPLYPQTLVPFLKKLLTFPSNDRPIVVHCSAGVGRTGTIILCDICLRMAAKKKSIDALFYLQKIREQRANMVDNMSQYHLVHMVLLECLTAPDTNIPCDNLPILVKQLIEDKQIQKQLAYLKETEWHFNMGKLKESEKSIWQNASKNRFSKIIPESSRIYLTRFPVDDEHSDYINAVSVDGFGCKEQFLVTQTPLPHTVGDFWRMINEQEVNVILSLNEIDENDETSCKFWPSEPGILNPVPFLTIKYISVTHSNLYDKYIVRLESKNSKNSQDERTVTIIQFIGWKPKQQIPNSLHDFLSLFCEVESLFRNNKPVLVSCYDGSTGCGLFVALSFIIEKIKLEQYLDVCLAVRVIRKNRMQFVNDEKQFEFLYQAAVAYLDFFELYANFQGPVKK